MKRPSWRDVTTLACASSFKWKESVELATPSFSAMTPRQPLRPFAPRASEICPAVNPERDLVESLYDVRVAGGCTAHRSE